MAISQSLEWDADWSAYVYWVVASLVKAEEEGIVAVDFRKLPEIKIFGPKFVWMLRGAILGVGNYGDVYKRNNEALPPRANQNLLNNGSSPQFWLPSL